MYEFSKGIENALHALQNWDVLVDGIQIFLCFFVLVFFLLNRSKQKKLALEKANEERGQGFTVQVRTQTIKQQVDQAFANIFDTIAVEQSRLVSVLQISQLSDEADGISEFELPSKPSDNHEILRMSEVTAESGSRHEDIQKLADRGMSARQISEKLRTSLGEVQLILSLNKS